jgi:hypothetical protein
VLKKISSVLFSSFLFISSINYAEATFIDDLVEAAKPDRETPWMLFDQPNIQFNEYHISALNRACGFRAFGYASRNDAIDAMLNALANIDEQHENRNAKLRAYIENDCSDNVEAYLKSLKNEEYELPYTINRYVDTDIDKTFEEYTYSLINAFALLNNISLCIYEEVKEEPRTISLTHSFVCDQSDEVLHLLCRGLHYNKLAFTFDENANLKAQMAENDYLNELRFSYEAVSSNQMMQPVFNNSFHNNIKLSDKFDENDQEMLSNVNNTLFSSNSEQSSINNKFNIIDEYMGQDVTATKQTQVEPSYPGVPSSMMGRISAFNSGTLYSNNISEIEFIRESEHTEPHFTRNILENGNSDNIIDENNYEMNLGDGFYYNPADFLD